jgi:hypothetical protein
MHTPHQSVRSTRIVARTLALLSGKLKALTLALAMMAAVVGSTPAQAQCAGVWNPFDPSTAAYPGTNGEVRASTMWDPDGPGPLTPRLVIVGRFGIVANTPAYYIADYDPGTGQWSGQLNKGLGSEYQFSALTTLPNGDLIAAGGYGFDPTLQVVTTPVRRWNGTAWSQIGRGMRRTDPTTPYTEHIDALTTLPNGDIIAGGFFDTADGQRARNIARWNGFSWVPLGQGIGGTALTGPNGTLQVTVKALTTRPNGDLIAAGDFTTAGTVTANRIARWNGSAWSPLGSGINGVVYALTTLPNGDIIAGGNFTNAGGVPVNNIARWNGSSWFPISTGIVGTVYTLTTLPNGNLIAGGYFTTTGGVPTNCVLRWNGTTWAPLGVEYTVRGLTTLPGGNLFAFGDFGSAGGVAAIRIALWNGWVWSAFGAGVGGGPNTTSVRAVTTLPNGNVIVGGEFSMVGGLVTSGVARWNGSIWSTLGTGMYSSFGSFQIPGRVHALTTLSNGDLIAGGQFTIASGLTLVGGIARWNGSTWSRLGFGLNGGGTNGNVYALTQLTNGDLIAGGDFTTVTSAIMSRIARWDGSTWSPLGSGMGGSAVNFVTVHSLMTLPGGDLIVGGDFTTAGGVSANRIARFNPTTGAWSSLGTGMNGIVYALTKLPNGDIIAGGDFTTAGGVPASNIARWDGSAWSALGTGLSRESFPVYSLSTISNGDLIVGGGFTTAGGIAANGIARWNGSAWSALGAGLSNVYSLTTLPNGDIIAGGNFLGIGGGPISTYIARYTPGTPAPMITTQPVSATVCSNSTATLTVVPSGTGPFTYQWRKGTVAINTAANPSAATAILNLTNLQLSDAGSYSCVVSNPCGSVTSSAAALTVTICPCGPSDVAGPGQSIGADGELSADDQIVFFNWYFANDPRANIAGPGQSTTPDGQFTADDIIVFLNRYFAGC